MAKIHFASKEIEREDSASKGDELAIDINRVVSDISATLKSLGPPLSHECCIYRVPNDLRRVKEAAYIPNMVSIGPLHHGKKTLKRMEKYKLRCLDQFLKRAKESSNLENFVSYIKSEESKIRSCYAETFDHLHSDKFVKMILVDAGFIFEHFLLVYSANQKDFVFYKQRLHNDIGLDLILLENQLPFFVLEGLYNSAFPNRPNNFRELTWHSFSHYNQQKKSIPKEVHHFTDLLRYFLLPEPQTLSGNCNIQTVKCIQQKAKHFIDWLTSHCCRREIRDQAELESNDGMDCLYSATELHEAGVKFEVSKSECLLDITFSDGVLTIPCLTLYDNTESYIRNLIALEQCHYPNETYISNYVSIMDHLIDTIKDVDLLVRKKIVVNGLGDQVTVATLFNKLGTHIARENDDRYIRLCKGLNAHCEVRCHKWKAILSHEYFSTPWRIASIFAAFILLVLTLIQTICAIISL